MTESSAEVGAGKSPGSRALRLAFAGAIAALLPLMSASAQAGVVKTWKFDVSGIFQVPAITFTGTMDLDFADPANPTVQAVDITVAGLPAIYNQSPMLSIPGNQAVVRVSDGSPSDTLSLTFTIPGFDTSASVGAIKGGLAAFGVATGLPEVFLNATGSITPDPSNPPIPDPTAPPPVTGASVPEPSTWVMMLLGFAGLGLAAKGRRAFGFMAKA